MTLVQLRYRLLFRLFFVICQNSADPLIKPILSSASKRWNRT